VSRGGATSCPCPGRRPSVGVAWRSCGGAATAWTSERAAWRRARRSGRRGVERGGAAGVGRGAQERRGEEAE
jgi:hypothetical protein